VALPSFRRFAVAAFIASTLLVSLSSAARAADPATIGIDPSISYPPLTDAPFTVSVNVTGVENLAAYEFAVLYDNTKLEFDSVANTALLGSTGRDVLCVEPADLEVDGVESRSVVSFGCGSSGLFADGTGISGPSGDGVLATLTFHPIVAGVSPLTFVGIDERFIISQSPPRAGFTSLVSVEGCTGTGCDLPDIPFVAIDGVVDVGDGSTEPADSDGDGILDEQDNCPSDPNADQLNTDAIPLGADVTIPNNDALGDACDPDDDNDGMTDAGELIQCNAVSPPSNPLVADTDGDRAPDRAECAFGTDATNPASKPGYYVQNKDFDLDGIPDSTEAVFGSHYNITDTDSDGVLDGIEVRGYASAPNSTDTDSDGCPDGLEIASINGDLAVNAGDLALVAASFGRFDALQPDVSRDGVVNVLDLMLVQRAFGQTCAD
jgi:hypothetical protein